LRHGTSKVDKLRPVKAAPEPAGEERRGGRQCNSGWADTARQEARSTLTPLHRGAAERKAVRIGLAPPNKARLPPAIADLRAAAGDSHWQSQAYYIAIFAERRNAMDRMKNRLPLDFACDRTAETVSRMIRWYTSGFT